MIEYDRIHKAFFDHCCESVKFILSYMDELDSTNNRTTVFRKYNPSKKFYVVFLIDRVRNNYSLHVCVFDDKDRMQRYEVILNYNPLTDIVKFLKYLHTHLNVQTDCIQALQNYNQKELNQALVNSHRLRTSIRLA